MLLKLYIIGIWRTHNPKIRKMIDSKDKSIYKHIFKSTSLFGGAQAIQVLASLVRGKVIALFLGTTGVGISGLLVTTYTMIQTICGLGLTNSAIREISKANETKDQYKITKAIVVYFRWLLFSALLGALLIILLSPWLSYYVFGNNNHITDFIFVSFVIVLNILSIGFTTILQGMQMLKELAKVSVFTAILTVLITVPIYYFFKTKGIVLALIAASFASFVISFIYARKIKLEKFQIGLHQTIRDGNGMVKLGIVMMIVNLIATFVTFLINTYISRNGSLKDAGLYQAGMNITNQSIGLVFTAMSVDYFPRLSAVSNDSIKVRTLANQQAEIMLLISTPILIVLILTAPYLIRILLSEEFSPITNFVRWFAVGMFFQAANYSMGLIPFAKGDKRTFLRLGIIGNFLLLLLSIFGYILGGVVGIGILFVLHSIICYILVYMNVYKRYQYTMSTEFIKLFFISFCSIIIVCISVLVSPNFIGYLIGILVFSVYLIYALTALNGLINLKYSFFSFTKKVRIINK